MDLPAPAGGDEGELLHIDVDEVPGPVALVPAHHFRGGPIHVIEPGQVRRTGSR